MNLKSNNDLFFSPANVGDAAEPNYVGRSASLECGATMRFSLRVDESQRIADAKFRAAGCSVMVTAASFLANEVKGLTTGEAASLAQMAAVVNEQIGPVQPERENCPALACQALLAAITEYSDSIRDEWSGDVALICTCFGVSERVIEQEVRSRSLATIEDVTRACNAGAGCRSCYPLIQDILDSQ
jgi:NifU-like protein